MTSAFSSPRFGSGETGRRVGSAVSARRLIQAQKRMIEEMERRRRFLELRLAELEPQSDDAAKATATDLAQLKAEVEMLEAQLAIYAEEVAQLYRVASEQAREVATRTADATRALLALLERLDPSTYRHSRRVARYADAIARCLDLSAEDRQTVVLGALLHDIGFLGQPQPPRTGGATTRAVMLYRQHPLIGARILRDVSVLERVIPIVLYHHERLDGLGFPRGLSGAQIPLHARIVAVANAYDGMLTHRPFSPQRQESTALLELRRHAGTRYDRRVVEALIQAHYERSWKPAEAQGPPPRAP